MEPLAYIELYKFTSNMANKDHGMYRVAPSKDAQGRTSVTIIPLTSIRQSCMLIPVFPKPKSSNYSDFLKWTPDNVLDKASSFLVNNFLDLYSYQTVY